MANFLNLLERVFMRGRPSNELRFTIPAVLVWSPMLLVSPGPPGPFVEEVLCTLFIVRLNIQMKTKATVSEAAILHPLF
jgi:hypothetical protein